jgi:hypothetical protein
MALFLHRAAGVWPGEIWNFTLHTTGSGSVGTAADAWETALATMWSGASGIGQYYTPEVVLETATTSEIEQSTGQQLTRQDRNLGLAGTSEAEAMPPQVALVVSLLTVVANRSGRGRFYLPSPAAEVLDGGRLDATVQGVIATAAGALFSALTSASLVPVIYSRTAHTTTTITSASLGDVFDTQRRRRDKLIEERVSITI